MINDNTAWRWSTQHIVWAQLHFINLLFTFFTNMIYMRFICDDKRQYDDTAGRRGLRRQGWSRWVQVSMLVLFSDQMMVCRCLVIMYLFFLLLTDFFFIDFNTIPKSPFGLSPAGSTANCAKTQRMMLRFFLLILFSMPIFTLKTWHLVTLS